MFSLIFGLVEHIPPKFGNTQDEIDQLNIEGYMLMLTAHNPSNPDHRCELRRIALYKEGSFLKAYLKARKDEVTFGALHPAIPNNCIQFPVRSPS